jgi:3D (Asp-Asp-Asp) domain-containing protein
VSVRTTPQSLPWYGSGLVPNGTRCASASLLAVCAGLCLAVLTPRADGAGSTSAPGGVPLALELYALETELAEERDRVAALAAERRIVAGELAASRVRLRLAETALATSQRRLALLVQGLYVAGEPDPLAVLFAAQSLDEAQAGLDALRRAGAQSRAVGDQARTTARAASRLAGTLAARARSVRRLEADARRRGSALEAIVDRRRASLSALRRREGAAAAAAALRQAESARKRSEALTASNQEVAPVDGAPSVRGVRRLTVDAVAYSLAGRTASGLPVGRGVAAVDPTVIPLGTRMEVPGYGTAVAADVGTAVRGLVIDLWFPTLAEARAWGRRTVTITLS